MEITIVLFIFPDRSFLMNRTVLAAVLAATLATTGFVAAAAAEAPATKVSHYQAGYYHFKIGDMEVAALSDGTLPIPTLKLLTHVKPGEVASRLADTYQTTDVDASVNAFLIRAGDRLILVDAGTGELYGPTLNKLEASLKGAGYTADQITDILITHIHTDHTGGLMDGKRMVFPNATVHIEQKEVDYWLNPEHRAKAPEAAKKYFDEAVAKVQPYVDAGKVKMFSGPTTFFDGISSLPAAGHTPGHTFYVLQSKGEKLVFWGDLVHVAEVQMPRPDVTIVFDVDPKAAAATRKQAFADAVKGRYWVAADHISFPGVGHMRRDGSGYRWVPMTYVNDHYAPK
jgi:glyoxylase-like metal-dependent hydrolase (beta-lactamase superfamily II)